MATCLSRLSRKQAGHQAATQIYETFPIWNLRSSTRKIWPMKRRPRPHDVNMIDPIITTRTKHSFGQHNRDIEIFPSCASCSRPLRGVCLQIAYRHGRQHGGLLHRDNDAVCRASRDENHPSVFKTYATDAKAEWKTARSKSGDSQKQAGVSGGCGALSPLSRSDNTTPSLWLPTAALSRKTRPPRG